MEISLWYMCVQCCGHVQWSGSFPRRNRTTLMYIRSLIPRLSICTIWHHILHTESLWTRLVHMYMYIINTIMYMYLCWNQCGQQTSPPEGDGWTAPPGDHCSRRQCLCSSPYPACWPAQWQHNSHKLASFTTTTHMRTHTARMIQCR